MNIVRTAMLLAVMTALFMGVGLLIGGFVLVSIVCTLALPETRGQALVAC